MFIVMSHVQLVSFAVAMRLEWGLMLEGGEGNVGRGEDFLMKFHIWMIYFCMFSCDISTSFVLSGFHYKCLH